jgi:hypothetical protein
LYVTTASPQAACKTKCYDELNQTTYQVPNTQQYFEQAIKECVTNSMLRKLWHVMEVHLISQLHWMGHGRNVNTQV